MEFDRRQFLALSSVGVIGAAGCVGSPSNGPPASATDTSTETGTDTASATATRTTTPEAAPPEAVTTGTVEAEGGRFIAEEELRYYNSETDSLEHIQPDRDWWAEAFFSINNLGGDPIYAPSADRFRFEIGGGRFVGIEHAPIEIEWGALRLDGPTEHSWVEPYVADGMIEPGGIGSYRLFLDIPQDTSPEIIWDSPDGEKRFSPSYVNTPGHRPTL